MSYPAAVAGGSPPPTVTYSIASGSFFPKGTTTVTVTATNVCGTATCTFTVTVTAPPLTITCPGSIAKFTDSGQLTATVNPGVPVTSGGCGAAAITGVRSDGKPLNAPYPLGVTTIAWTATDASSASVSCGQSIAVMAPSGTRRKP